MRERDIREIGERTKAERSIKRGIPRTRGWYSVRVTLPLRLPTLLIPSVILSPG